MSKAQRRMVLIDFSLFEKSAEGAGRGTQFREVVLVGAILLAVVAGLLGGYLVGGPSGWGPAAGALLALAAVAVPAYFIGTHLAVRKLRRYLESEEGRRMFGLIAGAPDLGAGPEGALAAPGGNPRDTEGPHR